jgi:hypothetical protein
VCAALSKVYEIERKIRFKNYMFNIKIGPRHTCSNGQRDCRHKTEKEEKAQELCEERKKMKFVYY